MRWLAGILIAVMALLLGGYVLVKGYPYKLYSGWIQGKNWNKYYNLQGEYRGSLLRPIPLSEVSPYEEDFPQLWKEFPLRNSLVPLPTRHPMYQVLPILDYRKGQAAPQMGVVIETSVGKEIIRLYSVPTGLLPDFSLGQDLFKLPFVRNRIMKKDLDEVWKDVFAHEIEVKSKSLEAMIHDLYVLHVRTKFLPKNTQRFGLADGGKLAIIELASPEPDVQLELILNQQSGSIYSFMVRSNRSNPESMRLRSKFLGSVSFSPPDAAMGNILYTEFKQLNFARQVDQEGMLYLFAAWSQKPDDLEFLKELIFFQERGQKNLRPLAIFYRYAYERYGKTFTTRKVVSDSDDPELELQRKIEIESIENAKNAAREKVKAPVEPELSPDERMNLYLKKAKESSPDQKDDMTIH